MTCGQTTSFSKSTAVNDDDDDDFVLLSFSRLRNRFKTQVSDANLTSINSFNNWSKRRGKFNMQVTTEATTTTQQPSDSPFVPGKFTFNKRKENIFLI